MDLLDIIPIGTILQSNRYLEFTVVMRAFIGLATRVSQDFEINGLYIVILLNIGYCFNIESSDPGVIALNIVFQYVQAKYFKFTGIAICSWTLAYL